METGGAFMYIHIRMILILFIHTNYRYLWLFLQLLLLTFSVFFYGSSSAKLEGNKYKKRCIFKGVYVACPKYFWTFCFNVMLVCKAAHPVFHLIVFAHRHTQWWIISASTGAFITYLCMNQQLTWQKKVTDEWLIMTLRPSPETANSLKGSHGKVRRLQNHLRPKQHEPIHKS